MAFLFEKVAQPRLHLDRLDVGAARLGDVGETAGAGGRLENGLAFADVRKVGHALCQRFRSREVARHLDADERALGGLDGICAGAVDAHVGVRRKHRPKRVGIGQTKPLLCLVLPDSPQPLVRSPLVAALLPLVFELVGIDVLHRLGDVGDRLDVSRIRMPPVVAL